MDADDKVCYCFSVSLRKLVNYARRERLERASQMSQCLDAGTGCGWCIPFLIKIWADPDGVEIDLEPDDYAAKRLAYHGELRTGRRKNEYD